MFTWMHQCPLVFSASICIELSSHQSNIRLDNLSLVTSPQGTIRSLIHRIIQVRTILWWQYHPFRRLGYRHIHLGAVSHRSYFSFPRGNICLNRRFKMGTSSDALFLGGIRAERQTSTLKAIGPPRGGVYSITPCSLLVLWPDCPNELRYLLYVWRDWVYPQHLHLKNTPHL